MTLQALAHLNIATLVDSFISLASAFALGSLIGFERQVRQRLSLIHISEPTRPY